MPVTLDVRADVKALTKRLTDLAAKQVPYATALALNAVALEVQKAEQENLRRKLDEPTPFTVNAVSVKRANKSSLTATVYVKDIAARYLEPFETGGVHVLPGSGKTWLNPKDHSLLNRYGNLPRTKLAGLRSRPDVFVGTITTAGGERIDGVWQRPAKVRLTKGGKLRKLGKRANSTGRLKLLLRFGDAIPVKQQLGFGSTAAGIVRKALPAAMNAALARAIETAK